jgi:hypothetical protein
MCSCFSFTPSLATLSALPRATICDSSHPPRPSRAPLSLTCKDCVFVCHSLCLAVWKGVLRLRRRRPAGSSSADQESDPNLRSAYRGFGRILYGFYSNKSSILRSSPEARCHGKKKMALAACSMKVRVKTWHAATVSLNGCLFSIFQTTPWSCLSANLSFFLSFFQTVGHISIQRGSMPSTPVVKEQAAFLAPQALMFCLVKS